jgi:hypothetical protein
MMIDEEDLQILWDKQEITDGAYQFASALDDVDGELIKTCFWKDPMEEHEGPILPEKFVWKT